MSDYTFKGFKDYIQLLDPIQNQTEDVQQEPLPPAGDTNVVLSHEPTIARIIDLASYRK